MTGKTLVVTPMTPTEQVSHELPLDAVSLEDTFVQLDKYLNLLQDGNEYIVVVNDEEGKFMLAEFVRKEQCPPLRRSSVPTADR